MPARSCEKSTGPRFSRRIATATRAKTGRQSTSAIEPRTRSRTRFRKSVERETSQVVYSTTERSATRFRRDGGAEHPARGRYDAQLDPGVPAKLEQVGEQILVDRLGRDDDAVDVGHGVRVELLHLVDDVHVDVGEELELAPGCVGERAGADDQRSLARDDPAPEPA